MAVSEEEVGQVDRVITGLAVYHFAVVKNLEAELPLLVKIFQVLPVLLESDVDGAHGRFHRRDEDFLLEDDSILGGVVAVCVLDWLAANNFLEFNVILVGVEIDLKLPFRGVVGKHTFDEQNVALLSGRQGQTFELGRVKGQRRLLLVRTVLVDNLDADVVQKVLVVRAVDPHVDVGVC